MRLSHIALAITLILFAYTGYLAWQAQEEARGAQRELELVRRQKAAVEASKPLAPVSVAAIPPIAPAASEAPPLQGSGLMPGTPDPIAPQASPAPLTALQKQLLGLPAVAKVLEVHKEEGFAVVSAGKNKQFEPGMKFDVRRKDGLVGRVIISDTVDAAESVVDIDSTGNLPGVTIEVGDELVIPVRK